MTNLTENVANEKVQDLTEQFNNDELDDRLYYFKQKMSDNVEVGRSFAFNMVRADDGEYLDWFLIDKVLAPVPSYEEWQKLKEENDKLKELLETCRYFVVDNKIESEDLGLDKVAQNFGKLLTQIDEVLK